MCSSRDDGNVRLLTAVLGFGYQGYDVTYNLSYDLSCFQGIRDSRRSVGRT